MRAPLVISCPDCGTDNDVLRSRCRNCERNIEGVAPQRPAPLPEGESIPREVKCLRCEEVLVWRGIQRLHEGTNWGAAGEIGELFVARLNLQMYVCPKCSHVEFFAHDASL